MKNEPDYRAILEAVFDGRFVVTAQQTENDELVYWCHAMDLHGIAGPQATPLEAVVEAWEVLQSQADMGSGREDS